MTTVSIYALISYIDAFVKGYTPTTWGGTHLSTTYYAFEDIMSTKLTNMIFVPYLIINTLILIVYNLKNKNKTT